MRKLSLAASVALFAAIVIPSTASAAWPVATRSSYISTWYSSHHPALDIAAPSGTHVVPIGNGTVVFAGWKSNCGGYQVWIRNRDVYTAYYHLSRILTVKGRAVTGQQTVIGAVGMTGCASGPHTHVEVWHGWPWASTSYRVNPWGYVDSGYWLPYRYR